MNDIQCMRLESQSNKYNVRRTKEGTRREHATSLLRRTLTRQYDATAQMCTCVRVYAHLHKRFHLRKSETRVQFRAVSASWRSTNSSMQQSWKRKSVDQLARTWCAAIVAKRRQYYENKIGIVFITPFTIYI